MFPNETMCQLIMNEKNYKTNHCHVLGSRAKPWQLSNEKVDLLIDFSLSLGYLRPYVVTRNVVKTNIHPRVNPC